ncbi:hypothetical protein ACFQ44_04395 [Levilactobacillus lanxiensis]|uniref:Restriction endonuclease n=1 Tax=Levilactobacillus lanxiensis TaxID=2799568 RepID=A0ABW4D2C2_9LACO|nr:hypothetical protein [Levilactobacillus lanxiensis]
MNDAYAKAFKQAIDPDVFRSETRGKKVKQRIDEENYAFDLVFHVKSDHAVSFRIEDFKNQAGYLRSGKRGAGKDNDCTIIDDAIFQIEVKRAKKMGHTHAHEQLEAGKRWLHHVLWLVVGDDEELINAAKMPLFNVIIQLNNRHSLSRSYPVKKDGEVYRIIVWEGQKIIDLSRAKSVLMQKRLGDDFSV